MGVSTQLCLTLCDPMDCSLPGSSILWIFQARILEWVAISFSRGSSQPKERTQVSTLQADSLTSEPPMLLSQFVPPSPTQLGLSHLIFFLTFCSQYLYMWKIRQRGGECKETWHQQTFAKHFSVRIALSYCQEPWNQWGSPGYSQRQKSSLPRLNPLPHSSTALSGYGILSRFYNWEAVSWLP